ncbi:MAG: ATP-binding protein [Bacteroidales bacterium]
MFVNREKEIERLNSALRRKNNQLIVLYGRRRCGKSISKMIHKKCFPYCPGIGVF